mgnify:CR=1 FL=1
MKKTFDAKIEQLAADPRANAFLLADAKDADMAFGMAAPGVDRQGDQGGYRSLQNYREHIVENVEQGQIDIMLMSASTCDLLARQKQHFRDSPVTPAFRANDATDIWAAEGGQYLQQPSRPFRTASLTRSRASVGSNSSDALYGADLALYSITFNNDVKRDRETLCAYTEFREEAAAVGLRHFLEVFDPNAPAAPIADVGRFVNDNIARALAGVAGDDRPLFLKIAYHGPAALGQLVHYDPSLIVGILGGAAGTTYDAFLQLAEARKYGARAALYGRMINQAEHQGAFIQHLRLLADGELDDPAEAVKSYHAALEKRAIRPRLHLADDLETTIERT